MISRSSTDGLGIGPTHRVALAIHRRLLTGALEETADQNDMELSEHWDLVDPHISALVMEVTADLGDGSPLGTIYGEALECSGLGIRQPARHLECFTWKQEYDVALGAQPESDYNGNSTCPFSHSRMLFH
jgi:hypothetical protein